MKNEFCAGNDAVGSFFLNARNAPKGFVRNIFAQARGSDVGCVQGHPAQQIIAAVTDFKKHRVFRQNFAKWVMEAPDGPLLPLGHGDPVRQQVVNGRSPEHGSFSAGVFRDIFPDARGPGAGGVSGKNQPVSGGKGNGLFGNHPGLQPHHCSFLDESVRIFNLCFENSVNAVQLFDIQHNAVGSDRNASAGQSRAAAAGDNP